MLVPVPSVFVSPFQSTPSVGRATLAPDAKAGRAIYFNPRPPWGGRLIQFRVCFLEPLFQSTPSVGRATRSRTFHIPAHKISIHALRGEGDEYQPKELKGADMISIHALRGEGDLAPREQVQD